MRLLLPRQAELMKACLGVCLVSSPTLNGVGYARGAFLCPEAEQLDFLLSLNQGKSCHLVFPHG